MACNKIHPQTDNANSLLKYPSAFIIYQLVYPWNDKFHCTPADSPILTNGIRAF